MQTLTRATPFRVADLILGEVRLPEPYQAAWKERLQAQQSLVQKQAAIEEARLEAQRAFEQAKGIAKAQAVINQTLTVLLFCPIIFHLPV